MYLVNCDTLELKEFISDVPDFNILSHTWDSDGELSFQDLNTALETGTINLPNKKFDKLKGFRDCIKRNQERGAPAVEWMWVDSCCIDKKSSAELSEAINSMFAYYERAQHCYVYLADVDTTTLRSEQARERFKRSKWFSRGWTLQELVAPAKLTFYNRDWSRLGDKHEHTMLLHAITGIPKAVLIVAKSMLDCSVARRFSWAAHRNTTRSEDIAYCLLGIFNVHMPLLYGEGDKAFVRLQEAILANSHDQTILAWSDTNEPPSRDTNGQFYCDLKGVLAAHPRFFAHSSSFKATTITSVVDSPRLEIGFTNIGLRMNLPLVKYRDHLLAVLAITSNDNALDFAQVPSKRPMSRWTPYVIRLWPECGGSGAFLRVARQAPKQLDRQLADTAVVYRLETLHLLRSDPLQKHIATLCLDIRSPRTNHVNIEVHDCHYSSLPPRAYTFFRARRFENTLSIAMPDQDGRTLVVTTLWLVSEGKPSHATLLMIITKTNGRMASMRLKIITARLSIDDLVTNPRQLFDLRPIDSHETRSRGEYIWGHYRLSVQSQSMLHGPHDSLHFRLTIHCRLNTLKRAGSRPE